MKFLKKSAMAAALVMAVSGAAEAKIVAPDTAHPLGGELVLNLVNFTTEKSYTLDLGMHTAEFQAQANGPLSFSANNPAFQQFLSIVSSGDDVKWGVFGAKAEQTSFEDLDTFGTWTTATVANPVIDENTADINNTMGKMKTMISEVNGDSASNDDDLAIFKVKGEVGYTGGMGTSFQTALPYDYMGDLGEALFFVRTSAVYDQDFNEYPAARTTYAGKWNFNLASGALTYSVPTSVPLPATAWMFVAGLMGVLRANRRKALAV